MPATPSTSAVRAALAIVNSTVNPAMRHDASNVTAPRLASIIERETAISDLLSSLQTLIDKVDDLIAAIDGVTDQFEPQIDALSNAATAAEHAITRAIGGDA